ncbi:MAG: DNA polymerase III subunit gamma/tau [Leptospirales bacterium]
MSTVLSLARKWRPQTFKDLVGQEFVVRALTSAMNSKKLPQAFLFSGERGVGKTTVARILAKAINCEKGPTPDPCQICESCREISQGSSPDVLEIDGASHTSVDDVRSLREGIRYLPFKSRTRIYIIDEVHMLSQAAFNALLKTLEEPPAHVVFVFATTEDHKIPDTILSRCQHFRFRSLSVAEITGKLEEISEKESLPFQRAILNLIARSAGGSMRDALSLLDQIRFLADGPQTVEDVALFLGMAGGLPEKRLLQSLLSGNLEEVLIQSDQILSLGIDPKATLKSLSYKTRDMMMAKTLDCPLTHPRFAWDEEEIPELPDHDSPTLFFLEQMLSLLLQGDIDIRRSTQPGVTFLLTLCRIAHVRNILPLPELLNRLGSGPSRQPVGQSSPPPSLPGKPAPQEKPAPSQRTAPEKDIRLAKDWHQTLTEWTDLPGTIRDLLNQCQVTRQEPDHYVLKAPNAFFEKRIQEALPQILDAFTSSMGNNAKVSVTTKSAAMEEKPHSVENMVHDNPMVQEATALFGGEVISVRKGSFDSTTPPTKESNDT